MALIQITGYTIQTGLKKGMTVDDFCTRYGCTEAEFERHVKRLYRKDGDEILKKIRDNVRKKNSRGGAGGAKPGGSGKSGIPSALPKGVTLDQNAQRLFGVDAENAADADNKSVPSEDATHTHEADPPESELDRMRRLERQQSDEVMALESQHKAIARKHRDCIKDLRRINGEFEKIQREFQAKAAEYEAVAAKNNEYVAQMNQLSAERAEKVTALAQTRATIKSLTVVVVCAYESGEIGFLDDSNFKLDDTGSDVLFAEMRAQERYDDLRGKDVRMLARMISIVKNSEINIEPVFENESLEPFFRALIPPAA